MQAKCRRLVCGSFEKTGPSWQPHALGKYVAKLGGQTGNNNPKQTLKIISSANHEVYDARGLEIRVASDPETIVNFLEPLSVDKFTHLWRVRLHKNRVAGKTGGMR